MGLKRWCLCHAVTAIGKIPEERQGRVQGFMRTVPLPTRFTIGRLGVFCLALAIGTPQARHLARYLSGIGGRVTLRDQGHVRQVADCIVGALMSRPILSGPLLLRPVGPLECMVGAAPVTWDGKRREWTLTDRYDWHPLDESKSGQWSRTETTVSLFQGKFYWLLQDLAVGKSIARTAKVLWDMLFPESWIKELLYARDDRIDFSDAIFPLLGGRPFTTIIRVPKDTVLRLWKKMRWRYVCCLCGKPHRDPTHFRKCKVKCPF